MGLNLRAATEADLADIVDVSTAAFEADAIMRRLTPSHLQAPDGSSIQALRQWRIARKIVRFRAERTIMMVAVDDEGGKIVGYSIWQRPVGDDEEEEEQQPTQMTLTGVDQDAYAELHRILGEDERESFGDRGTKDIWHLASIGVHPQYQKRGIGKILLNWGVQEASKQGKDCYLVATPTGVALYRAAGFENVRTMEIFGTPHVSMRKRHSILK
ncbi:acyl-CoA N-acyltransferase [Thelonectria olida]|uniref:Acyl-CoA N-acyltransferase n=1 Tax=Thelonectria olida TaxID=1576542 RepID=A0A9P8W0M7_9HYPO|nr:acyl-CoA N-acyltransferase [Thelonectria olida]